MATEGWGARLLALQGDDGQWDGRRALPGGLVGSTRRRPPDRARGPALDRHGTHAHAAACVRGRPERRAGATGRRSRSETTAAGSTKARRSSKGRSSRASTAASRWASTSGRTSRASSSGWWVNSSRTAGGTARRSAVRALVVRHHDQRAGRAAGVRASVRRSADSVAVRRRGEEYLLERRLFRRRARARSIDRPGCSSRFRRAGTTTCCVGSTTSGRPAGRRTRGSTRRWSCCG